MQREVRILLVDTDRQRLDFIGERLGRLHGQDLTVKVYPHTGLDYREVMEPIIISYGMISVPLYRLYPPDSDEDCMLDYFQGVFGNALKPTVWICQHGEGTEHSAFPDFCKWASDLNHGVWECGRSSPEDPDEDLFNYLRQCRAAAIGLIHLRSRVYGWGPSSLPWGTVDYFCEYARRIFSGLRAAVERTPELFDSDEVPHDLNKLLKS